MPTSTIVRQHRRRGAR